MVSIKEVAKVAGVSIATVSRYLNNPSMLKSTTNHRVRDAIDRTGYAPNTLARNFRMGKTGIIVVVVPSVSDPFFEGAIEGINQVAAEQGLSILFRQESLHDTDAGEYSKLILSKQADGIILLASTNPFEKTAHSEDGSRLPIVVGCESISPELSQMPSVRIDNHQAAEDATTHLIALGHTRIAFMSGDEYSMLTDDREAGYRTAMKKAGMVSKTEWVVHGGFSIDSARIATRSLASLPELPTAIFCATDQMALACMYELKNLGFVVPKDISVVGFDDMRFASISNPPLTTVAQPTEEIGRRSMQKLLSIIDETHTGSGVEIVAHRLVIRESTCAPHAHS